VFAKANIEPLHVLMTTT